MRKKAMLKAENLGLEIAYAEKNGFKFEFFYAYSNENIENLNSKV